MVMPSLFPPRREIMINYDFVDVLSRNAYLTFYGGKSNYAEETDPSYETGRDTYTSAALWYAQTFTTGNSTFWVKKIKLWGYHDPGNENITVKLQAVDGDGKPDGTDLTTGTMTIGTTPDWDILTLSSLIRLDANTQYAIVFITNAADEGLGYDASSPTYTGGSYLSSADSGSTWTIDTAKDFLFKVVGSSFNPYLLFTKAFTSDLQEEITQTQLDFEIPINMTAIIKGNCLLNVNTAGQTDIKAEIFRVRGNTALSLGSTTTEVDTARKCILIDLDQTPITKGDVLRLTINSASGTFAISYSTSGEELELYVPFKLDL